MTDATADAGSSSYDHMESMIEAEDPGGRNLHVECPLMLVTGSLVNAYAMLFPGDKLHDDFSGVWRQQREWDRKTHYTYWRAALRVWPVADGQVRRAQALGAWVWSWRRSGMSDAAIADRLGYQLDTLRRRDALRFAKDLDKPRERRWVRAPLVVAVEHEEAPHPFDTWCDPRLNSLAPRSVHRIQGELIALTGGGPRGTAGWRPTTKPSQEPGGVAA